MTADLYGEVNASPPTPLSRIGRVIEFNARYYKRTWRGSVATTLVNPLLYLAAMGLGLGQLVDDTGAGPLAGSTYLEFLAPGLVAAAAMQTGAGEGSWVVIAGIKWRRTYHSILATPVTVPELVMGHLAWATIRVTMTVVAFALVALAFGAFSVLGALATLGPAIITGLAFAAGLTAFTANLEDDQALAAVFRFGIVPMFLFSGTFFPVSSLPDWAEPIAAVTPLWHGVELSRGLATGGQPAWDATLHVAFLLVVILAGAFASFRAFELRLQP